MPRMYSNLNIDFLFEDDETAQNALGFFINNFNHSMKGYKYLYLRYNNGNMEAHITNEVDYEDKNVSCIGVNVHCANTNVWKLKVISVLERNYDDYVLALCSTEDGHGMCPVCLINPDVLPRIAEGDMITVQVAAFPTSIETFENEEAYSNSLPKLKDGEALEGYKLGIADGMIFPARFLSNHQPQKDGSKINPEDCENDDVVLIRGTIQEMRVLSMFFGEAESKYLMISVNTQFGELGLILGRDQLGHKEIKVGDIILANCVISADVAIYDYDKGAVINQENLNLLLLDALESGDYSRLKDCLAEDCHFLSKWSGKEETGRNDIIAFMESMYKTLQQKEDKDDYFFLNSYVVGLLDNEPDDVGSPQWKIGDKCIIECCKQKIKAAFFLSIKDEKITRIDVDTDHRYKFFIPPTQD